MDYMGLQLEDSMAVLSTSFGTIYICTGGSRSEGQKRLSHSTAVPLHLHVVRPSLDLVHCHL